MQVIGLSRAELTWNADPSQFHVIATHAAQMLYFAKTTSLGNCHDGSPSHADLPQLVDLSYDGGSV